MLKYVMKPILLHYYMVPNLHVLMFPDSPTRISHIKAPWFFLTFKTSTTPSTRFPHCHPRVWSLWRGRTGRCHGGRARPWVNAGSRHPHPKSACLWSRRCRRRRWWRTWVGGRRARWPLVCLPCQWWRRLSESAGWNIPARWVRRGERDDGKVEIWGWKKGRCEEGWTDVRCIKSFKSDFLSGTNLNKTHSNPLERSGRH